MGWSRCRQRDAVIPLRVPCGPGTARSPLAAERGDEVLCTARRPALHGRTRCGLSQVQRLPSSGALGVVGTSLDGRGAPDLRRRPTSREGIVGRVGLRRRGGPNLPGRSAPADPTGASLDRAQRSGTGPGQPLVPTSRSPSRRDHRCTEPPALWCHREKTLRHLMSACSRLPTCGAVRRNADRVRGGCLCGGELRAGAGLTDFGRNLWPRR